MRMIYVSYDGALDPLGASQVIPYVVGLAATGIAITLITFEKRERWADPAARVSIGKQLKGCGIRWRPQRYHKRPRMAGTLWDLIVGSITVAGEASLASPDVVHCRGDIATAMARWARLSPAVRVVYDIRGFFAEERVETGSWRRGGVIDRAVRRIESSNLQRADGVVVLTRHAAEAVLRRRPSLQALRVIPTCADLGIFRPRPSRDEPCFGLVYSGSLGTWYMGPEMMAFARAAESAVPGPTLFLTPQPEEVRRLAPKPERIEVRSLRPGEVAKWLCRATALFFFIKPIPSKTASCPTKFAEGLASGLPVVCNRGIGELDDIVEREKVGVLVDGFCHKDYSSATARLSRLLQDPNLSRRCRRLAEERFGVDLGVRTYLRLYEEIKGRGVGRPHESRSSS